MLLWCSALENHITIDQGPIRYRGPNLIPIQNTLCTCVTVTTDVQQIRAKIAAKAGLLPGSTDSEERRRQRASVSVDWSSATTGTTAKVHNYFHQSVHAQIHAPSIHMETHAHLSQAALCVSVCMPFCTLHMSIQISMHTSCDT